MEIHSSTLANPRKYRRDLSGSRFLIEQGSYACGDGNVGTSDLASLNGSRLGFELSDQLLMAISMFQEEVFHDSIA
jgi:hypothetical protein